MSQSTTQLPRSRRCGRFLAVTAVTGAMVLGFAQPAVAAPANPAPPSPAYAAPATTSMIAAGTGVNYWASDFCHYFQQVGWQSDLCMRRLVDANGKLLNKIGMFQNLGNGLLGREMIRVDYSDPTYVVSGFFVLPGGERWLRSRKDSPGHVEIALYDPARGSWFWHPAAAPAPTPDPRRGENDPTVIAIRAEFERTLQRGREIWLAPACNSSYNGCA